MLTSESLDFKNILSCEDERLSGYWLTCPALWLGREIADCYVGESWENTVLSKVERVAFFLILSPLFMVSLIPFALGRTLQVIDYHALPKGLRHIGGADATSIEHNWLREKEDGDGSDGIVKIRLSGGSPESLGEIQPEVRSASVCSGRFWERSPSSMVVEC